MSADNITRCPKCGVHALREYHSMGLETDKAETVKLMTEYSASCHNCLWSFDHRYRPVVVMFKNTTPQDVSK